MNHSKESNNATSKICFLIKRKYVWCFECMQITVIFGVFARRRAGLQSLRGRILDLPSEWRRIRWRCSRIHRATSRTWWRPRLSWTWLRRPRLPWTWLRSPRQPPEHGDVLLTWNKSTCHKPSHFVVCVTYHFTSADNVCLVVFACAHLCCCTSS